MKIDKEKISKMIFDRGFTINSFAEKNGIKQQSLSAWLKGEYNPRPDSIHKLAECLNCHVSDISDISSLSMDDPNMNTKKIFKGEKNLDELDDKMILIYLKRPKNKKLREKLIYNAKIMALQDFIEEEEKKKKQSITRGNEE